MDNTPAKKPATDQDLLMAVAGACRLSSPSVKAILMQREKAEADKAAAAEAKETAATEAADAKEAARVERAEQRNR